MLSGQTWSLADDWSDVINPSGQFTVGVENSAGVFAPFTFNTSTAGPNLNLNYLGSGSPAWVPNAAGYTSAPGLFESDGPTALDTPDGTIGGKTPSSVQGNGYIVRWTAPASGPYHIDASLWNLVDSGSFNRFEIRHVRNAGGTPTTAILRQGGVMLPSQGIDSTDKLRVAVPSLLIAGGDYIDLFVARSDGFNGEFVGMDFTIGQGAKNAELDYVRSAAADFYADFVAGVPQHNPNSNWSYLGPNGLTSDLEAHSNPGSVAGAGTGWRLTAAAGGGPTYSYNRALNAAFSSESKAILGHGPMVVKWTAPAEVDLGGVEITGLLTQADFEAARQMQLRIYKNDAPTASVTVNADFANQRAIVPVPAKQLAISPGDTLTIVVDGAGPLGNGVPTFASWDVQIREIDPQINSDFDADFSVGASDLAVWTTNFGAIGGANRSQGDANDDTAVNGADFLVWQRQFGNSIDGGPLAPLPGYHPSAIFVQPSGVTLPDGRLMDISGSQTQGIQEAFNLSANEGWDVFVLPGSYTLNAPLDIEEIQLRTFRIEDATFNFTSNVTDFGIRFDSTMLTNWYWKGGAINAPNATHGVLFQPRTPHPLDGVKFGTKGVVDSRFHFNVDIFAGVNKVTMNSTQATINDIGFQFKNVTKNQINYVGNGFANYNIFEAPRTDDPIPFDLFSTAGRVTVVPPLTDISAGQPAKVYLPDGSLLNVVGTQTFGLQEAFAYAGANDLDLVVFGRGVRNSAPFTNLGLYNLNAPLNVSDLVGRTYRIYGVTFNNPVNGGDLLRVGDLVNADLEITGQLVGVTSDNVLVVRPDGAGVQNSVVFVQATVGSNGVNRTGVTLDSSAANIQNSTFIIHEVNGGYFGIQVKNPSESTQFSGNLIRSLHTHATGSVGVQMGQLGTNSNRITSNTVEVRTFTDGVAAYAGLQVYADFNTFNFYALSGPLQFGARFEASSNNNVAFIGTLVGSTPLVNLGASNIFLPATSLAAAESTAESALTYDGLSGDSQGGVAALDEVFASFDNSPLRVEFRPPRRQAMSSLTTVP